MSHDLHRCFQSSHLGYRQIAQVTTKIGHFVGVEFVSSLVVHVGNHGACSCLAMLGYFDCLHPAESVRLMQPRALSPTTYTESPYLSHIP
jgi:hypothetical protein